jgi:hypothetical protein
LLQGAAADLVQGLLGRGVGRKGGGKRHGRPSEGGRGHGYKRRSNTGKLPCRR